MCDDNYSITQISGFEITAENVGDGITVLIGGGNNLDKFDKFNKSDKSNKLDKFRNVNSLSTALQFRSFTSNNPALSYNTSCDGREIITDLTLPDGLKPITGQNLNESNNIYVEKITDDPLVDTLTFRNLTNSDGTKDISINNNSLDINENYTFNTSGMLIRSVVRISGTHVPSEPRAFNFNKLFNRSKNYIYMYITEVQIIKTDESEGEVCSFIISDQSDNSILLDYSDELNDTIITGIPYKGILYPDIATSSDGHFMFILTITVVEFETKRKMKNKGTLVINNNEEMIIETKYLNNIMNEISCKSD